MSCFFVASIEPGLPVLWVDYLLSCRLPESEKWAQSQLNFFVPCDCSPPGFSPWGSVRTWLSPGGASAQVSPRYRQTLLAPEPPGKPLSCLDSSVMASVHPGVYLPHALIVLHPTHYLESSPQIPTFLLCICSHQDIHCSPKPLVLVSLFSTFINTNCFLVPFLLSSSISSQQPSNCSASRLSHLHFQSEFRVLKLMYRFLGS